VLALLLGITTALLLKRWRTARVPIDIFLDLNSTAVLATAILFTLWIFTSILWSANPYSAAHFAFQWGAYILFFILIRMVAARPRVLRASIYSLGSVVWLLGTACLLESVGGGALTDHALRLTAKPLMRGFSGFSETMAIATPIFIGLALEMRKARRAALCGATALFAWVATLQALERAPILGAAGGILLITAGTIAIRSARPRMLHRAGLLAFAFVLITVLLVAPFTLRNADSQAHPNALQRFQTTSVAEPGTSVRLLFWMAGWEMFRAHPFLGVGANNYEVAFPWARARFAEAHMNSSLVEMNEDLLTQYAHNEYVQILAELGGIGVLLFSGFCFALIMTLWRALCRARRPLLVLGSGAGLFSFALSSGASAFSFRWVGSGLMFFFAAAIVSQFVSAGKQRETEEPLPKRVIDMALKSPIFAFSSVACAFAFAVLMLLWAGAQGTNSVMHALAQTNNGSPVRAEKLYRSALLGNPFDAGTHYDFGSLLYQQHRVKEAIPHLRYAVEHGINTSTSFASLAAAEEESGDLPAAEQTLAYAVTVYPHSVFLLVKHAASLSRLGRSKESDGEFSAALLLDARSARGWYHLINFDIDAALVAAQQDHAIATPGELLPENAVYVVLKENERRLNIAPNSGWRGLMHSVDN
jgi:O-antigen ligase